MLTRLLESKPGVEEFNVLQKRNKNLKKLAKMLEGQSTKNSTFYRSQRLYSVTTLQKQSPRQVIETIQETEDMLDISSIHESNPDKIDDYSDKPEQKRTKS